MILRGLTLAGGMAGAAATAQFPEYSQQYMQRLGGAADALSEVVADFDASAAAAGLSREAALAEMTGSAFLERRQGDMRVAFARHERLQASLAAMEGQGPFMRAYHLPRMVDRDVAVAAWEVYEPAVPLNFAGVTFGGVGFLAGLAVFGLLLKVLAWPFRRRVSSA